MHAPPSRCAPFTTLLMMSMLHPQAVATSIQDQAPHSRNTVRFQIPASLRSTMMAHVPNVTHSHQPEPLTALARLVQEPSTSLVATRPPSPLPHPAPGKNNIIPSRNDNAANNFILICQPIKNEVAQHSRNNIFSLLNIRQEIKNRNGAIKRQRLFTLD